MYIHRQIRFHAVGSIVCILNPNSFARLLGKNTSPLDLLSGRVPKFRLGHVAHQVGEGAKLGMSGTGWEGARWSAGGFSKPVQAGINPRLSPALFRSARRTLGADRRRRCPERGRALGGPFKLAGDGRAGSGGRQRARIGKGGRRGNGGERRVAADLPLSFPRSPLLLPLPAPAHFRGRPHLAWGWDNLEPPTSSQGGWTVEWMRARS